MKAEIYSQLNRGRKLTWQHHICLVGFTGSLLLQDAPALVSPSKGSLLLTGDIDEGISLQVLNLGSKAFYSCTLLAQL